MSEPLCLGELGGAVGHGERETERELRNRTRPNGSHRCESTSVDAVYRGTNPVRGRPEPECANSVYSPALGLQFAVCAVTSQHVIIAGTLGSCGNISRRSELPTAGCPALPYPALLPHKQCTSNIGGQGACSTPDPRRPSARSACLWLRYPGGGLRTWTSSSTANVCDQ